MDRPKKASRQAETGRRVGVLAGRRTIGARPPEPMEEDALR
jgi:hypothetical protein